MPFFVFVLALVTAASAEPVALHWRWPAALELTMAASVRADVAQGESTRVLEVKGTHALVARKVGDEVHVVTSDDPKAVLTQLGIGKLENSDQIVEAVVLALAHTYPSFRVDAAGRYDGLLDADAAVDAFFAQVSAHVGVPGIGSRQLRNLARARMDQRATDLWSALVGYWRGTKLEPGKRYPGREPMMVAGATDAGLDLVFSVTADVPCGSGRCAELTVTKTPDATVLAAMKSTSGNEANATEKVTLVTHAESLVPYQLVMERSTRVGRKRADGTVRVDVEVSREELRFSPK